MFKLKKSAALGLVIFFTLLNPLSAFSSAENNDPEAQILKKYSLEQLDSAGLLLMGAVDHPKSKTPKLYCGISDSEASALLLPLHALIDQKIEQHLKSLARLGVYSRPEWQQNCRKTCHCGIYASVLEKVGQEHLQEVDRKMLPTLQKQAQQLSPKQIKNCTQNTRWVCKSDLLSYLRASASGNPEDAAPR